MDRLDIEANDRIMFILIIFNVSYEKHTLSKSILEILVGGEGDFG